MMRVHRLHLVLAAGLIWVSIVVPLAQAGDLKSELAQATQTQSSGPRVFVPEQVNLRSGPGVIYEQVGVMIKGQEARALGKTPLGEWIQIEYIGVPEKVAWVYAPLVNLNVPLSSLPIIEPPATPTQAPFPTLDPQVALSLVAPNGPTRLPTFTPAPPVAQPTLLPAEGLPTGTSFPPALLIVGFFVLGLFGVVVSFLRATR